jgi:hypothetical protein
MAGSTWARTPSDVSEWSRSQALLRLLIVSHSLQVAGSTLGITVSPPADGPPSVRVHPKLKYMYMLNPNHQLVLSDDEQFHWVFELIRNSE